MLLHNTIHHNTHPNQQNTTAKPQQQQPTTDKIPRMSTPGVGPQGKRAHKAEQPAAETYPQVFQPASYEQVVPYVQSGPPAGWHPDPQSPGLLRYWDGWQWTEHRSAVTPQATAVVYNNIRTGGGDGGRILLHIVLIFLTCGVWIPFAIIIEIINAASK